ncbi:MAG TPA: hypothetical protein VK698_15340 [Kofleriaceae bacterium]|nr:hypothetical protein [Kofleriaceae bacterium]
MQIRSPRSTGAPALVAAALAALVVLAASSTARAQPGAPPPPPDGGYGGGRGYGYYPPPPPDPYRRGFTLGFGVGLGAMDSGDSNLTECFDCNYDPIALAFDFHLGAMINPQLAIMGEVFWHAQNIDADGFNWLSQSMLLGAIQFWVTPQLWLKGGIGVASLDTHYDDGYDYADDTIDTGIAVLGAVGYEVLSAPWFSIDLQARLASGSYEGIDEQVSVGTVGVGFNWY